MRDTGNSNGKRSSLLKRKLEAEWEQLCQTYLPVKSDNSPWRFNRAISADDPAQGWKIHISATTLTATRIFKRVAPVLQSTRILFKAIRSLEELQRLNCGLFYGYSQVGKFMTVYTRSPAEAVKLARQLDGLVGRCAAPTVPYDLRYRKNNCIFYRYGAFGSLEIKLPDGTRQSAIKSPSGELVIDQRSPGAAIPNWETDPFSGAGGPTRRRTKTENPLETTIRVYQAISQRGKGGVYRAIDTSVNPLRLCVLKEGRRHGETDWAGRDGYWRVRHEEHVLASLREMKIKVPGVYTSFRCGPHYYLALEFIEGVNLQALLNGKRRKLPISVALGYARQAARLMQRIHAAGWVWRDCKPLNLIVNEKGNLWALDFEGACRVEQPDYTPWGTPGYSAPESRFAGHGARLPEDLYALGATLYHLFSGRVPSPTDPSSNRLRRRDIPLAVRELISSLLDTNPQSRPSARTAHSVLSGISL